MILLRYAAVTDIDGFTVDTFHYSKNSSHIGYVRSLCWTESSPVLRRIFRLPNDIRDLGGAAELFLDIHDARVPHSVPIRMRVEEADVSDLYGEIRCGNLRYGHYRLYQTCKQLIPILGDKPAYLTLSCLKRRHHEGTIPVIPRKKKEIA
jgi:hypothetical protein